MQPVATAGNLWQPDADNKIVAVSRGGGRQISNWFDILLRPLRPLAATSRVTGGQCIFLRAAPEVMPKYGGRSLVGFCGNSTLGYLSNILYPFLERFYIFAKNA